MRAIGIAFAWALLAPAAFAHVSGNSVEKRVGPYLVDVGYDAFRLVHGRPIIFSPLLIDKPGTLQWDYVPYTSVELAFVGQDGKKDAYARSTEPPASVFIQHVFLRPGAYTLEVAFFIDEAEIARTELPIEVARPPAVAPDWRAAAIGFAAVCAVTVGLAWAFTRDERKRA